MKPPISVLLDHGEHKSQRALDLAKVVGGDPTYELETKRCSHCKKEFSVEKFPKNSSWCYRCKADYTAEYRRLHPEQIKRYEATHKKERAERVRNRDHLSGKKRPMEQARDCSSFLGVHVAERVLAGVFKNVERMPYGHPGYDFICAKGFKIDVKSSCRRHQPKKSDIWIFGVCKNEVADYFLFLAFDNRSDLNPEHVWLVPGSLVNSKTGIGISDNPASLTKWDNYERPIDKIATCCDAMREMAHA